AADGDCSIGTDVHVWVSVRGHQMQPAIHIERGVHDLIRYLWVGFPGTFGEGHETQFTPKHRMVEFHRITGDSAVAQVGSHCNGHWFPSRLMGANCPALILPVWGGTRKGAV